MDNKVNLDKNIVTRAGIPVTVVCRDWQQSHSIKEAAQGLGKILDTSRPLVVSYDHDPRWRFYYPDGSYERGQKTDKDLVNLEKKISYYATRLFNLFENGFGIPSDEYEYSNFEDAKQRAQVGYGHHSAVIRVVWDNGIFSSAEVVWRRV